MSGVSLTSQIWSCAHPKVNGDQAARAQSTRTFDPRLNSASMIYKNANDAYSGRPSVHSAANGTYGIQGLGYAGLNPTDFIRLETGLRQVEFVSERHNTAFYDTIEGANRTNWPAQRTSATCQVVGGPESYTNAPTLDGGCGNGVGMTAVDRKKYLDALYTYYKNGGQ